MNKRIKELQAKIDGYKGEFRTLLDELRTELQAEYNKAFENDKALNKALDDAQSACQYEANSDGIYSWFRYAGLDDIEQEAREYLENYAREHETNATIDWETSCFHMWQGDDCLIIQDDTRHDNGVWQAHKLVIKEAEYKDDDGEIDEKKRNALIEAHMEKTGYFPGVFRVDSYGNVSHVKTN